MIEPAPDRQYRCKSCWDQGMAASTSGRHNVGHDGRRTTMVDATEDRPVYRVCRGPMGVGCPWRAWRASQAVVESSGVRSRSVE